VGKIEFAPESGLLGAPGKQILRFEAVGLGQSTLKLVYHRPWEKGVEPAREFSVQAVGRPATAPAVVEPAAEKGLTKPLKESMRLELPQGFEAEAGRAKPKALGESALAEADGWTTIMTEDFEWDFPGTKWDLDGNPTWDETSHRAHSGNQSGYCADGGSNRLNPPGPYPNDMDAWMVYGPFDLSDATDAELLFYHWTKTEANYYDYLFVGASVNGNDFYGEAWSGDWVSECSGWCSENFDLTDVYLLGDLCGYRNVWIAFVFYSDFSITDEGTYLDDIVLRKVAGEPPSPLPAAFDWRTQGGVTPVKDQEQCGSCWAFSTVGTLEANIKIKDAATKDLSEQYLVSCNTDGWGCDGGWWAHDYHRNKIPPGEPDAGAVYEADFPYVARDDPCSPPHTHHEKIDSWAFIGSEGGVPSVQAIRQAVYDYGPVSAAVCAGNAFQAYGGGVFETDETCAPYATNHAIVLVGWDDNQGNNGVWILKNSWGPGWCENGYMRIGYGISLVGYSANYVAYTPQCDLFGNLDGDGDVDVDDIMQVASRWRMTDADPNWDARYDLDDDGNIDIVDIMKVSAHWGDSCD